MTYSPMQLADAFISAGELDDALESLNQQLDVMPNDETARRLRAQVLMRLGGQQRLQQALDDLNRLPPRPMDGHMRSVVLERLGQPRAALAAAQAALDASTEERLKSRLLERVLGLMHRQGQIRVALALALRHDWVQWAADAAADLQDDVQAAKYYTQALDRIDALRGQVAAIIVDNIRARVLLKRAGSYQRLNKLAAAEADYVAAAEIIPDDPMIPFNRGLIAVCCNQAERGEQLVRQAAKAAPSKLRSLMRQELQADERYAALRGLV